MLRGEKMNEEEMKSKIYSIISDDTSINVFFVLTDDNNEYIMKKADLAEGETTEDFIELFRDYLFSSIVYNDDLRLCDFSSSDESENAVYFYDYDEYPKELSCINSFDISEGIKEEFFSFSENNLSELKGYLIYLGSMKDGIVLYKKHYPISLIKRDSFLLYKKDKRFVKFDGKDLLRISGSVQVMKLGSEMFVLETKNFEKNFGFESLIIKSANEAIEGIENKGILEDIQVLKDSVEDISFARKLSKVREKSPVITLNISNEDIIAFTKTNPGLRGKFKYSDDNKKIRLDTKASKTAFVKMLNDDYLRSELTKQDYTSIAKNKIEISN